MNVKACYRLADGVAMRPERFGGLIYRYDNRRLYFIHSPETADFLTGLDGSRTLHEAVADFVARKQLGESSGDTLIRTVEQLENMGIVERCPRASIRPPTSALPSRAEAASGSLSSTRSTGRSNAESR